MKKLLSLVLVLGILLSLAGCKKKDEDNTVDPNKDTDIENNISSDLMSLDFIGMAKMVVRDKNNEEYEVSDKLVEEVLVQSLGVIVFQKDTETAADPNKSGMGLSLDWYDESGSKMGSFLVMTNKSILYNDEIWKTTDEDTIDYQLMQEIIENSKAEQTEDETEPRRLEKGWLSSPPHMLVNLNDTYLTVESSGYTWVTFSANNEEQVVAVDARHPLDALNEEYTLQLTMPSSGFMIPIYTLNFDGFVPEAVIARRWPVEFVGNAAEKDSEYEELQVEVPTDGSSDCKMVVMGTEDYVYEVVANFGEAGVARYAFSTSIVVSDEPGAGGTLIMPR